MTLFISRMKSLKVSLLGVAVGSVLICLLFAKVSWEQKIEQLQVINQVNIEEIDKLQSKVKELTAELQIKESKIVELESQPQAK